MNPQSSITFPLGVTTYYLAKAINSNGEHARITYEHKYKRGKSNILLKHNLNIISQSIGSQQTHHSNSIRITYVPRLLGNVVISKKFLRTRKIMVMHSNEGRVLSTYPCRPEAEAITT